MTEEDHLKWSWKTSDGTWLLSFKTIEQGASTSVWAAVAPELEGKGGLYLQDCNIMTPVHSKEEFFASNGQAYNSYAMDPAGAEQLWTISEKMIAAKRN